MAPEEVTLYAALIAAGVSVLTLIVTAVTNQSADLRSARRAAISASFSELGDLLYEVAALSMKMTQMKRDGKFDEIRKQAESTSEKIDCLRRKTRYPLWGIDDGFRAIQWLPVYMAHMKNDRSGDRAKIIMKKGTSLREAMDLAICHAYFTGEPPTHWQRLKVWWRARNLRKYFDEGKPE